MQQREDSAVALVTGAARGMGREIACRLAEDGFELVVADVRPCDETAAEIRGRGGAAHSYACDIRSWDEVRQLVDRVESDHGPIRAGVQVAGVYNTRPFLELTPETWHHILDVNLEGTFNFCRHVAAPMARRGSGAIVCISSTAAWLAWDASTHYLVSKAAIAGLVRGAAYELGPQGVRVNAVAPGTIRTPATADELALPGVGEAEALATPLRRVGEPTDIAEAVAFLCDDRRSPWITGQTIVVDGGYSTHGENSRFGADTDTTSAEQVAG